MLLWLQNMGNAGGGALGQPAVTAQSPEPSRYRGSFRMTDYISLVLAVLGA